MTEPTERKPRIRRQERSQIEVRLLAWGDWMAETVPGLSYPSQSPMEAARTGRGGIRGMVPLYTGHPEESELHKQIIELHYELQRALYARYVLCYAESAAAYHCGCSIRAYCMRQEQARSYLSGKLGLKHPYKDTRKHQETI